MDLAEDELILIYAAAPYVEILLSGPVKKKRTPVDALQPHLW